MNKKDLSERSILEALLRAPDHYLSKGSLADLTGYSLTSSGFANALSPLRTRELIEGRDPILVQDAAQIESEGRLGQLALATHGIQGWIQISDAQTKLAEFAPPLPASPGHAQPTAPGVGPCSFETKPPSAPRCAPRYPGDNSPPSPRGKPAVSQGPCVAYLTICPISPFHKCHFV